MARRVLRANAEMSPSRVDTFGASGTVTPDEPAYAVQTQLVGEASE